MTNKAVLENVMPLLGCKNGRLYRRRSGITHNEKVIFNLLVCEQKSQNILNSVISESGSSNYALQQLS